jgi:hypothetical protein
MILILHIVIALSSIAYATLTYFTQSKNKLRASWSLVILTIASGTWLVVSTHSALLQSCVTGLIYLAVVSAGIIAAQQKLKQYN